MTQLILSITGDTVSGNEYIKGCVEPLLRLKMIVMCLVCVGLHVFLESLVDDRELSNEIRSLLEHCGRVVSPVVNTTVALEDGTNSNPRSHGLSEKQIQIIKESGQENWLVNGLSNHGINGQHIECDA